MKDLSGVRNALGTELADERGEAKVLNGAVLMFDQGSPFIHECMIEFNRTYRIDSWGWNGPELVTRVASRFPQGPQLHILPTSAFYAIHWAKARWRRRKEPVQARCTLFYTSLSEPEIALRRLV